MCTTDFEGTCYKAAGWSCVGQSAGRRDGVPKAVWVHELAADARQALRYGPAHVPRECPDNPEHWAEAGFGALRIWDARLKRRAVQLAEDFFGHAQAHSLLVHACQGRRRKVSTEAGRMPLSEHVQALPVAGHTAVDIPRRQCGPGRALAHWGPRLQTWRDLVVRQ